MVAIRVTMVPHEHVVYTTGQVVDRDICPSRNFNCIHSTAADGTWHDVPLWCMRHAAKTLRECPRTRIHTGPYERRAEGEHPLLC
jgi:hypothetical protein